MPTDVKTDNSHFAEKVCLRNLFLPTKKNIRVLECFAGHGRLWNLIRKNNPDRKISSVKIDVQPRDTSTLKGDNVKFLASMDLTAFDVVDLDAYGIPFEQCRILFSRGFSGIVHVTAIQSGMGQMPVGLLECLGFPKEMTKKCPSLFNRHGIKKFLDWLGANGIDEISYFRFGRKLYGTFYLRRKQ